MDRYCKIKVLGHGAFGKAWLVSCNKTHHAFVVKEVSIPALKERDKQSAINEVKILATLKHKNIILYKEAFVSDKCLCIIMEYADDGDLAEKIKKQNGVLFMEFQIIDWFVQILIAVKYIHSLKILHRDLKSQNIFLTKEGFVKIGDFGVSRCLEGGLNQAKTAIGTPYYLSPEICQQQPYDMKSDMWSLGILIYEMATLGHPFVASDFQNLIVKIVSGKYPPVPGCFGPLIEDLVLILLQVNPKDRPNASQLLKVPTLQPHIRSYLLHAKNNGRSKSQERLNVISNDSKWLNENGTLRRKSPAELRRNGHHSFDRLDIQPTDSAYGSENEHMAEGLACGRTSKRNVPISEIYANLDRDKSPRSRKLTNHKPEIYASIGPGLEGNETAKPKAEVVDPNIFRMREDVGQKRSSYIEAISATDQSSTDLNITFIAFTDGQLASDANGTTRRRRSIETSSSKKMKEVKARRRSCEVESTGSKSKLKLPRRLSVDSIGEKKELQARNDEKENKPKSKGSLSTLKKLIRRNSKSSYETIEDSLKLTNHKSSKSFPTNQNEELKSRDEKQANKKSKPAINFIERNRKLAETPKTKAAKKQTEKNEQKVNGKASKTSSFSVVSEAASPIVSKQRTIKYTSKSAEKKKQPNVNASVKTPSTISWKPSNATSGKTPAPSSQDTSISEADLFIPLLRKRSLTFDSRETFMKFGKSAHDSTTTKGLDVTELDCIDVFTKEVKETKDQAEATDVIMPLKSDKKSKFGQKKKVRHQSSNVFPDGFRVKDTIKRKIMGRLRASSYTCDNTFSTTDNPSRQNEAISSVEIGSTSDELLSNRKMNHSKTYTLINSNATITLSNNSFTKRNIDPSVVNEAVKLIKKISLSPQDIKQLCQAAAMIDGDNHRDGTLVALLRLSLTK